MIAFVLAALLVGSGPKVPDDPVSRALLQELGNGLPPAAVGQWVTYRLEGGMHRSAYWRLAVVGKTHDAKGRDAVWVEMELSQTAKMVAPLFQMRMLIATRNGLDGNAISRVIVAAGTEKPRELDPRSVEIFNRGHDGSSAPEDPKDPGLPRATHLRTGKRRMLMTQAGTLEALPVEMVYRDTVLERFWMSRQIPVLQLAKVEMPAIDQSMEVRDFGLDARSMMRLPDPSEPKLSLDPNPGGSDAPNQTP